MFYLAALFNLNLETVYNSFSSFHCSKPISSNTEQKMSNRCDFTGLQFNLCFQIIDRDSVWQVRVMKT